MNNQNFNNEENDSSFQKKEKLFAFLIVVGVLAIIFLLILFFTVKPKEKDKTVDVDIDTPSKIDQPITIHTYPYKTTLKRDSYDASPSNNYEKLTSISSKYMALIDLDTMEIVLGRDYSVEFYPASMTKVMTTIVALDLIENLDDTYLITKEILNSVPAGSSCADLNLLIGQEVSIRSLIYGVTYRSGADAVLCLVNALGYSVDQYVELMNAKAKEIGLSKTHFGGVIGMDTEHNQTTAKEMAMIYAFVVDNPQVLQFFSGESYRISSNLLYYNATLVTTLNQCGYKPTNIVDGYTMIAAKSGYETKAGSCLVSYTESSNGKKYVLVTAKADSKQDYIEDYRIIYNYLSK